MVKAAKTEKTNAMRLLAAAGVVYQSYSYSTEDGQIDGMSVAAKTGFAAEHVFKTLVAMGASRNLYVFVIPVCGELDLKKAARAAGEKSIVMLPQKDLLKHTGYIHGGCSPLGMKKLYPTFIDASAQPQDSMVFSGGKIGTQIACAPTSLADLTQAQFVDLCKY